MVVSLKKRGNRERNLLCREDNELGFGCMDFAVTAGCSTGYSKRHWQSGTGASECSWVVRMEVTSVETLFHSEWFSSTADWECIETEKKMKDPRATSLEQEQEQKPRKRIQHKGRLRRRAYTTEEGVLRSDSVPKETEEIKD